MSSIQTFSRLALKQFCALLEGVAVSTDGSSGDLEGALWSKIQAGNPGAESLRVPYPLLKKALRKFKLELPYMPGVINYNIGCSALKVNGSLYLPCCGKCEEDSAYCGACSKHELKYGVLEDRGEVGTYSDPTDKHEISFGTWLAKNEKTLEEVYEALASEGFILVIPSHHLTVNSKRIVKEVKNRRQGRPPKATKKVSGDSDDSGSESEVEEPVKVKKPKAEKSKKVKESDEKPKKSKAKSPKSSDADSDDEKPKKSKAKSPKSSDADSDGEVKVKKPKAEKSKKVKESDESGDEKPVKVKKPKAEKSKKVKGSDADSDSEKPKKPKTKSPKGSDADSDSEKPKKSKAKSPKGSELDVAEKWSSLVYGDDDKKAKKPKSEKKVKGSEVAPVKAEKSKKVKKSNDSGEESGGETKTEKKVKSPKGTSNPTDISARFGAELTAELYVPSDETVVSETVEVDGTEYNLRGKRLFDKETGEKVGEMNDDGVAVLDPEDF